MAAVKQRLLMVDTEFGYDDLWKDLIRGFKNYFEVEVVGYNEGTKKINKFDPEFVFYFQNLRANTHSRMFSKKKKVQTMAWVVDDIVRLDENVDSGILYTHFFVADYNGYRIRADYAHKNVYYMPPCINPSFFQPNNQNQSEKILIITHGKIDELQMSASLSSLKFECIDISVGRSKLAEAINSSFIVIEADRREEMINGHKVKAATPFSGLEAVACKKLFLFDNRFDLKMAYGFKLIDDFISAPYSKFDEMMNVIKKYSLNMEESDRVANNGYNLVMRKHTIEQRIQDMVDTLKLRIE